MCNFPRVIPDGAMTDDGFPCVDAVPFCAGTPAVCGGTCEEVYAVLGPTCCPEPEGFCDICEGRTVFEDVMFGEHSCMDTIGFCATDLCGMDCDGNKGMFGFTCCTPEPTTTIPTTTTTTTRLPTAQPFESVNQSHKIVYMDPKLQHGTHVALLAGSWTIRAEGAYVGNTTCDRPLVDDQVFTGLCACDDNIYGKCIMSMFYNLGAPCPSSGDSCGIAVPADGRITTPRAGVVYFQIADAFYEDNEGNVTLMISEEDDGWKSAAVTSARAKIAMFLMMVVSLLC